MNTHDPDYSYWSTAKFKAYKEKVKAIIYAAKEPISKRAIDKKIGKHSNGVWTMDCIDMLLVDSIKMVGTQWKRYAPYTPEPRRPFIIDGNKQTEWNRYQAKLSRTYPTAAIGVNV